MLFVTLVSTLALLMAPATTATPVEVSYVPTGTSALIGGVGGMVPHYPATRGLYRQATRFEVTERARRGPAPRAITSITAISCSATNPETDTVFARFQTANWQNTGGVQTVTGTSQDNCDAQCQNMGMSACAVTGYLSGYCYYSPGLSDLFADEYTVDLRGYTCDEAKAAYPNSASLTCTNVYCV